MSRKCPNCGTSFADEIFFCGYDGTITVQEQDPSDVDPRLGQQLGGYIVVARVADGAMGRVYEGRHPETRERVAIKVLHADVAKDDVAVERFRREYETAEEFKHEHIVKVLEFGETGDGSWFMTMEYLVGEELSHRVRRDGHQPLDRVVRLVCQTALGLEHAHSFGVIHRDLKPDNIYLSATEGGDVVRILDFGSVKLQMETGPKLTAFGTTLGSPYYMSPEQAMGKQDVDQRTDVFALAAIIFEMLTGRVCFEGNNVAEILMKIVNGTPPAPSSLRDGVPPALDAAVARGVAKDKTQRFGSARELAQAVCESVGLASDLERWAATPTEEIRRSMGMPASGVEQAPKSRAEVVPAAAFSQPALPDVAPVRGPRLPTEDSLRPPRAAGPPVVLLLGVIALGLVGMAGLAYWLMG